jgi:hypothetical protein
MNQKGVGGERAAKTVLRRERNGLPSLPEHSGGGWECGGEGGFPQLWAAGGGQIGCGFTGERCSRFKCRVGQGEGQGTKRENLQPSSGGD